MNKDNKIEEIFMESYDEFGDAIFRYAYFQTSDKEVALDISQETFTKTWQYLQKGQEIDNIRAFLYRVARNLIIDYRRKKKAVSLDKITETGIEFESDDDIEKEKELEFDKEYVLKTLEEIEDKYRDVLILRYVEEMSIKEISESLEKSENNISVIIHRGVEKLKKLLENYNE